MKLRKIRASLFVAALALGFVSHGPDFQPTPRKVSSVKCADPEATKENSLSTPILPAGLFSFISDSASRQSAESYALFLRQMEINSRLFSLTAPSQFGFSVPAFPSYKLPSIANYEVSFSKPPATPQIFGGLSTNPQLQYLIRPTTASGSTAAPGSLNSVALAANLAPLPNPSPALSLNGGNAISASKF